MDRPIQATTYPSDINPKELLTGKGRYALRVRGDSLINIGIMDGDYAVIQTTEEARNGDLVVALINRDEVTLRRIVFHNADNEIELRAENKELEPRFYPFESIQVQGRLIGLFRTYRN